MSNSKNPTSIVAIASGVILVVASIGGVAFGLIRMKPASKVVEQVATVETSSKASIEREHDPNEYDNRLLVARDAAASDEDARTQEIERERRKRLQRRKKKCQKDGGAWKKGKCDKSESETEEFTGEQTEGGLASLPPESFHDCDKPEKLDGGQCNDLGLLFYYDRDKNKHFARHARRLFRVSCRRKNKHGCNNSAFMSERGIGGDEDKVLARDQYMSACNLGEVPACSRAGKYLRDDGKHKEAYIFFEKGCDASDARSCHEKAKLLKVGPGDLDRDANKALATFKRACDLARDNSLKQDSCINVATMRDVGDGVAIDREEARQYYTMACDAGSDKACARSKELEQ